MLLAGAGVPLDVFAATSTPAAAIDMTGSGLGITALVIFFTAYALIIGEEAIHLRKSKPVMVAAGFIWLLVAIAFIQQGDPLSAGVEFKHDLLEFADLFLFLLAAMTYINKMEERGVFDMLRDWLVVMGFSTRTWQPASSADLDREKCVDAGVVM